MNLSSILTQGMWAILDHSAPLSLLHCFVIKGQSLIYNSSSEDGRPASGKDVSFGQSLIRKYSRKARFRNPLEDKYFNFGNLTMMSSVREEGNVIPISSSGKDTASGHPMTQRIFREVSLCKPQSIGDS